MVLTITLNDELVRRLETQARRHDLPVADWAIKLLSQASDCSEEDSAWEQLNSRRFELIEKKFSKQLTSVEAEELLRLQESVDQVLKPWDQAMIDRLAPLELKRRGELPQYSS